jgi:peptide deformylase
MEEQQIKNQIEEYKKLLTGDLFADGDIQQKIYDLKKQLNPRIEEHPEEDDDEGCLNCGS